ncbi:putative virulence factor [Methylococcus sp. ANG]|uniref:putative virulence factor n=1 Tax=Methylococcus sp. ANG TaxID=3231903 RepID=UPI003458A5EE
MTNWDDKSLTERCDAIFRGAGEALDWVAEVRNNAQRLDREGDGLIEKLRRSRNLCRRLGAAAKRPFSAGVFGMSQAGKSYLISTLARSAEGDLQTLLDGKRVDFIGHLNPPGGGKEATGLVTRFTRKPGGAPQGFPVELTLFSEGDIAKILGNSFFNDFDRERVSFDTDPEKLRALLGRLEPLAQPEPTGGLSSDEVIDLIDYFERRFEKSFAPLRADYWPKVIELAPRLRTEHRAELLSVLWGEIPDLTRAYRLLAEALARMSHAGTVFVPLAALVSETGSELAWRADSILNVDVLDKLGKDGGESLKVLPQREDQTLAEAAVSRPVLAALTAELRFVLADAPAIGLLEEVDLLDFPGYRGRLDIADLEEVRKQLKREDADPVAQLMLRAKVAYLFERYTEDQEMNVLLMCTRCDSQIEVTSLAPALSAWVHGTQGETPADRGARPPGLVWVVTQLDRRLEAKPGQTAVQQRQEWANMVHITLLERFAQCDWLNDWTDGKPFDNVFLVRKPGMLRSAFKVDAEGMETDFLSEDERQRLAGQRDYFLNNEAVQRHVRDAGAAWDAVLSVNDGGMTRLAEYLRTVCLLDAKWSRIGEQVVKIQQEIGEHRLLPYFQAEGAGEVEKKKRCAEQLYQAVVESPDGFGELLYRLHPAAEQLRRLYLAADATGQEGEADAAKPAPARRGLINLPVAKAAEAAPVPERSGRAENFAKAAVSAWIRQLRALPEQADLLRYLGLGEGAARIVSDELVTGTDRHKLERKLVEALRPLEEMRGTTRIGIVDQQVMAVRRVIGDFVDLLGWADTPVVARPESPLGGRRLFEPPAPITAAALPQLGAEELNYPAAFIVDWLEAFRRLAMDNAGHSAGREITPEQNLRLGEILATLGIVAGH